MALIENKISIDEKSTKRILDSASSIFQKLFNQPKWLLITLISSIVFGGCYFWYSTSSDKEDLKILQEQIIKINKEVNQNLGTEELIYIITEIKILEMILEENYDERIYEMEAISNFATRCDPNDPIIADLNSIKQRMQLNRKTYKQHYDHIMTKLDKIVAQNDSTFLLD